MDPAGKGEAQLLTREDANTLRAFRCVVEEEPSCSREDAIELPAAGPFVIGDFLEDGRIDLALLSPVGSLMLVAEIGPPIDPDVVGEDRRFEFDFDGHGRHDSLPAADADDDGHTDVLVQSDVVAIHFGDGSGGWPASVAITPTRDQARGPSRFARMGDGLMHVVVGSELYLNNGDRTFAAGLVLGSDERALLVGDFDLDEGEELLSAAGSNPSIIKLTAEGELMSRAIEIPSGVEITSTAIIGDYDGDGRDDLAHGGYVSRQRGCSPDDPF